MVCQMPLMFQSPTPSFLVTHITAFASAVTSAAAAVAVAVYSLQEYADQDRLKAMVSRYSEFIDFPIYLQVRRTE